MFRKSTIWTFEYNPTFSSWMFTFEKTHLSFAKKFSDKIHCIANIFSWLLVNRFPEKFTFYQWKVVKVQCDCVCIDWWCWSTFWTHPWELRISKNFSHIDRTNYFSNYLEENYEEKYFSKAIATLFCCKSHVHATGNTSCQIQAIEKLSRQNR